MAITDPRLPLPNEDRNKPLESDWMRLRKRLVDLFSDLIKTRQFVYGSLDITNLSTSGTATLASSAAWVASRGFTYSGADTTSCVASLSLSSDGLTITATRVGNTSKLTCHYVIELR